MFYRTGFVALLAGCLAVACAGCMGAHRTGRASATNRSIAPDDVALRPNPNAPYVVPGGTPHLIPRATALDTAHAGPCDPEVLSVEEISGDTTGIFRSVRLAFMNRGAVACRLGGYPEVSLLSASGEPIGSVTVEKITQAEVVAELARGGAATQEPPPSVILMPHQVAAFQIVWSSGTGCSSAAQILVRAPSTSRAFLIPQSVRVCTGRIQVTALRLDAGDI